MNTDDRYRTLEVFIPFNTQFSCKPKVLIYYTLLNVERHAPADFNAEVVSVCEKGFKVKYTAVSHK